MTSTLANLPITLRRIIPPRLRVAINFRAAAIRGELEHLFPAIVNEGEATAIAANLAFPNYPSSRDYRTKQDAVEHLQLLWNILDDWDGSRRNVLRSQYGLDATPETAAAAKRSIRRGRTTRTRTRRERMVKIQSISS
ncbi:hypothetical protein [Agromyces humi]|uniref:hypothetical protein n=1 Tax=Agromyces humi TaxID=1766800 RepID=UPI001356FCFC|nr:hypothetical protein [Agromyces humi]